MRHLAFAFAFVLAGVTSAFAYDSPKALLEALYTPYTAGDSFDWEGWDVTVVQSTALNDLFAKDRAETPEGDVGRIDFDPYIDGQDYDIGNLVISEPVISGDTATAEVTFTNFDEPEDMTFSLVKEADGWKVDDVTSHRTDSAYSLQALLLAPL